MGLASRVIAAAWLVWPAVAGDITGHAVITKRLTKRTLSPIIYNLRGLPPPSAGETESINEFDRMVVMLEGGPARLNPPVTAVLDQRNIRFDPDLIVIPIGSTVEFPDFPILSSTTSSLCPRSSRSTWGFIRAARAVR